MSRFKNRIKFILPATLLLFLTSCQRIIDEKGNVIADKVIRLGDSWSLNQGVFEALIVWPISQGLNFISQYTGPVVAILIITLIVKLATLKSTMKSQIMSQKMQEINPKIQEIQAKYKDRKDQAAQMQQAQELQNLYRKHDIKLSAAFVPMLLQFPILIALWQGIQRSNAVITGSLFGHSLMTTPLQGMQMGSVMHWVLYIVLMITQTVSILLPSWLAQRKAKKYPGQKVQKTNGMMYFMVVLFAYFGLVWNSGMTIYFIISSIIQIGQTLYSQKVLESHKAK